MLRTDQYSGAALVTPDGMPLVRLLRLRGLRDVGRVYGPELMPAVCDHLQRDCCRHFFYGGAPGTPEQLAARLKRRYPEMQIAGTHSPPFHRHARRESAEIIAQINDSAADIVWVGLGAPKQEYWIAEHRATLSAPALIGVGYAFDVLAGTKGQAPRWLRNAGFEWAFRLACEPLRLWPRIFIDGPLFLGALGGQMLGLKRFAMRGDERTVEISDNARGGTSGT